MMLLAAIVEISLGMRMLVSALGMRRYWRNGVFANAVRRNAIVTAIMFLLAIGLNTAGILALIHVFRSLMHWAVVLMAAAIAAGIMTMLVRGIVRRVRSRR